MRTDWMARASCAGSDRDFHDISLRCSQGEPGEAIDWAKFGPLVEMCAECPVIRECATFAMRPEAVEQYGCWAGTTGAQRMKLQRADDPVQAAVDAAAENLRRALQFKASGDQVTLEGVA